MTNLVRASIALVVIILLAMVGLVYLRAKAESANVVTPLQRQAEEDERLLRQLVHPDMTAVEAEAVPTYSDFARLLRNGVVTVLRSRESLRARLTQGSDLLERYPADGVPGRHLKEYLRQNSEWKQVTLRSLNEQTEAVKTLRGDMYAFFTSNPTEYDRVGKRFEATIAESIQILRPAAGIVERFATARAGYAQRPDSATRAAYTRAAADYEAWKRVQ
ncbi:MAG: hypothetical protein ACO1SV_17335 [Fimbriimonas sp.]